MNRSTNNKFSKTVSQFYLEPLKSGSLTKVNQSGFYHKSRLFRTRKVDDINRKLIESRQRSLINYGRLSQVLEAQQKVFRSSSSFANPQQACTHESNKKLSTLLKSHILQRDFEQTRINKRFESERQKSKQTLKLIDEKVNTGELVSNYRYYWNDVKRNIEKSQVSVHQKNVRITDRLLRNS